MMKKFITGMYCSAALLASMFILPSIAWGRSLQDGEKTSFPTANAFWFYAPFSGEDWGHPDIQDRYTIEGPETFAGKSYYVMAFRRDFFDGAPATRLDFLLPPEKSTIHFREEGGRVYVPKNEYLALLDEDSYWSLVGNSSYIPYAETAEGELLLYDFNMTIGYTLPHVDGYEDVVVEHEEDVITLDGVTRKRWTLNNGYIIIEGIGCINSPGELLFYLNPQEDTPYKWAFLLSHKQDMNNDTATDVFEQNWEDVISGIGFVQHSSDAATRVFDLQGRRVTDAAQKGTYIVNGKKVVVR
jgi:hypothetical protein